jgi:uroporphyrinogen decarboxylase
MKYPHIPVDRPSPDADAFVATLMGKVRQKRTPLVEYIVDETVMRPIVENLLGVTWPAPVTDRTSLEAYLDVFIAFWQRMGYDFVRFEVGLPFAGLRLVTADTAPGSNRDRAWVDEHHGMITDWDSFETYSWPRLEEFDFHPFEYVNRHLPEGMGLIACHGGGIFEHLSWIMSLEGLSLALYEAPDLVQAVADRIGELMVGFYRHLVQLDRLIVVFPGDDMGFRSGTLIHPSALRKYCLPWHRRFAQIAHESGRPYFLHSCGNLATIMDDLIEDVGIDGKHSYEDVIRPVEDFQAQYGDRIAVLGGMDLNILSAGTEDDVRRRTRYLIETCGGRGRYAIGSGNSIPSYVPVENYLAMVDETHKVNAGQ